MLNTPFDVVKTRIQNQAKGAVLKYDWTLPGVAMVYREEGYVLLKSYFVVNKADVHFVRCKRLVRINRTSH